MILVEICYKTYDGKIFAIIKDFKTWQDFYKISKYKLFIYVKYNNIQYFLNTKNQNLT